MDCRSWDLNGFVEPALKVCRESFRILDGNTTASKHYGYSRSEWCRLSLLKLHPESEHHVVRTWMEVPQPPPRRFTHLSRSGELFRIQMRLVAASRKHPSCAVVLVQGISGSSDPCPSNAVVDEDPSDNPRGLQPPSSGNRSLLQLVKPMVAALGAVVEYRDPGTAKHQLRVARIAETIGQHLSLDQESLNGLRVASLLHDIGKLTIPAALLSKPGTLSSVENLLVQSHVQAGYEILKKIDVPLPVAQIVFQHHERLDGTGYPNHLAGDEILAESKILAVADALDAMTSHRPYRPALRIVDALEEIASGSGSLYDRRVAEICPVLHTRGLLFADA